ncbi:tail protein [Marinomonas sp. S3726]|uniref:tail protein X n=1 Tax=Marinomonas sp. S3726 TaxID=579484 RepID=UPI0005FA04C5|nr:tail protein X [Marinomonas sp. S3726]KJZ10521.1 tail protein [Marinomonas sp. S3726]
MKTLRSREGDSISLILWMGLKRTDDEAERALYNLNPHLIQYGPILPAGLLITLPALSLQAQEQTQTDSVVNLWD